MLDDFLIRAMLAGVGAALAAAPLGCFVVWRRMAYFGDATAHAAVLGVTLALATEAPLFAGVLAAALAMAALISVASGRAFAADTLLGVAAHSALAAGLVAAAFLPGVRLDLMGYLFGDILAVSRADLALIWLGAAGIWALMAWRWRRLLTATLSEDLAVAEGIDPRLERLTLMLALALLVALALKVVGALLITALLIIPAAAARGLARTPEAMAGLAALFGAGASLAGLRLSWTQDTPAGPSIVLAAAGVFLAVTLAGAAARAWRRGALAQS